MTQDQHINEVLTQEVIRYSQVWEDHALLEEGLEITPNDRILSIASAGCNAFAMLLCEPEAVVAVDLNPTQTAIVQLKKTAIEKLDYPDFIALLGARPDGDPLRVFDSIKGDLPPAVATYWESNRQILEAGLLGSGRLEGYFSRLSRDLIEPMCPPDKLQEFLNSEDLDFQAAFFETMFGDPRFIEVFKQLTSQKMIASEGRDEVQFRFVNIPDVGQHFYDRFKYVCTRIPCRGNFYLEYLLTGRYRNLEQGPPSLRESNFKRLKELVPRLEIVTAGLDEVVNEREDGYFSKANLSDLFEYLSESETEGLLQTLATRMRTGGKLAYWNLLVPRHRPESLSEKLTRSPELSEKLWLKDRALFYRAFHIETVQ